jgi:carboxypeptidase Taq
MKIKTTLSAYWMIAKPLLKNNESTNSNSPVPLFSKIDTLDDHLQREVKKAKKSLKKIINVPEEEFVEYQKLIQMSQQVWQDAKENNDYDSFKGNLKQIIGNLRKLKNKERY